MPRLGPEARQWRYRTIRVANVLAVGDKIVVLLNERLNFFIPFDVGDFVVDGVGAEIHETPNFKSFFSQSSRAGNIQYRICMREQPFCPGSAQTEPFLVRVAAPISPALFQTEAFGHAC